MPRSVITWLSLALLAVSGWVSAPMVSAAPRVDFTDAGMLTIQAGGAELGEVMDEMRQACGLEIQGLEGRARDSIGFNGSGPPEVVVKSLLQWLGVTNYAMEFQGGRLCSVTVAPGMGAVATPAPEPADRQPSGKLKAAMVAGFTEGGQAQGLGLEVGDIVLTYNGERIETTRQLIQATRRTDSLDSVEMMVLRDGLPFRVYLSGGFIGIRIKNAMIDNRGLEKYLNE